MNIEALKSVRENFKMGYVLSFAEAMLIQQAIDAALQSGNSAQPVTVPDGLITDEVISAAYERHLYGIMSGTGNKRAAVDFLNECLASMRIKP
nr:MAG TPA: hypothetical protein [Caudoviricetes sp.]